VHGLTWKGPGYLLEGFSEKTTGGYSLSAPGRERERGDATLGQRTGTHTCKAIPAFLDNYSQTNQRPKFVLLESGTESYLISSPERLGNRRHYWLGGKLGTLAPRAVDLFHIFIAFFSFSFFLFFFTPFSDPPRFNHVFFPAWAGLLPGNTRTKSNGEPCSLIEPSAPVTLLLASFGF